MINSIHIRRFKNLEDFNCDLGRVTVLVGSNNAGKSTVLQALQFSSSVAQTLNLEGKPQVTQNGASGTIAPEQLIYSPFRDIDALAHNGKLTQSAENAIVVDVTLDDSLSYVTTVRRGKNKNLSVSIQGDAVRMEMEKLDRPYMILSPGLAGIPSQEEFRSEAIVRRAAAKGDANSVLRNILWLLKRDDDDWADFLTRFTESFPGHVLSVTFDDSRDEIIHAHILRNGVSLPLDAYGTGVLQTIQILAYIGLYHPKVLLLDEPDSHLHPSNQRSLARQVFSLAEELDFQVVISTHSRHMLEALTELGATIHWLDNGIRREEETDVVEMLFSLGALDVGDRLRNNKTRDVVLTEDTDTKLLEAILESNGFDLDETEIFSYKTCSNLSTARLIGEFVRKIAPKTSILVHRDRDYFEDEYAALLREDFAKANITLFTTCGIDIESYFLNSSYLSECIDTIGDELINGVLEQAIEDAKNISLEKMNKQRVLDERTRLRIHKPGSDPNYHQLSLECDSDFALNRLKYVHGKTAFKRLKHIFQTTHKLRFPSPQSSKHLFDETLTEYSGRNK